MSNNPHFMNMTADTLGKSLLQGLIQEIRIMPDCWQKLPEAKQQDIIDRLERQVRNAATIAVHTIAGGDRDTVYGKLESMTAKDKMKAVFVVNPSSPHKEDLLFAGEQGLPAHHRRRQRVHRGHGPGQARPGPDAPGPERRRP